MLIVLEPSVDHIAFLIFTEVLAAAIQDSRAHQIQDAAVIHTLNNPGVVKEISVALQYGTSAGTAALPFLQPCCRCCLHA